MPKMNFWTEQFDVIDGLSLERRLEVGRNVYADVVNLMSDEGNHDVNERDVINLMGRKSIPRFFEETLMMVAVNDPDGKCVEDLAGLYSAEDILYFCGNTDNLDAPGAVAAFDRGVFDECTEDLDAHKEDFMCQLCLNAAARSDGDLNHYERIMNELVQSTISDPVNGDVQNVAAYAHLVEDILNADAQGYHVDLTSGIDNARSENYPLTAKEVRSYIGGDFSRTRDIERLLTIEDGGGWPRIAVVDAIKEEIAREDLSLDDWNNLKHTVNSIVYNAYEGSDESVASLVYPVFFKNLLELRGTWSSQNFYSLKHPEFGSLLTDSSVSALRSGRNHFGYGTHSERSLSSDESDAVSYVKREGGEAMFELLQYKYEPSVEVENSVEDEVSAEEFSEVLRFMNVDELPEDEQIEFYNAWNAAHLDDAGAFPSDTESLIRLSDVKQRGREILSEFAERGVGLDMLATSSDPRVSQMAYDNGWEDSWSTSGAHGDEIERGREQFNEMHDAAVKMAEENDLDGKALTAYSADDILRATRAEVRERLPEELRGFVDNLMTSVVNLTQKVVDGELSAHAMAYTAAAGPEDGVDDVSHETFDALRASIDYLEYGDDANDGNSDDREFE